MGSRTTEAEQQVAQQRRRISGMLDEIEERTRRDIKSVEDGVAQGASDIRSRTAEQIEQAPGVEALTEQVSRRPMTSVAAGFGVGIALGVAGAALMPGREEPRRRRGDRGRAEDRSRDEAGSSGMMGMLTGTAMSTLVGPLQDEVQTLLRQAVAGFLGRQEPATSAAEARKDRSPADTAERRAA